MRVPADDEPTVILAAGEPSPLRLVLSSPQRPYQDVIVDYLVTVSGAGLEARTVVTSQEGDSLDAYFSGLAEGFRGWTGVREWRSLEGQFRAEARWANRGHVKLYLRLRATAYDTAWDVSFEFDIEAGAEMESLSIEVSNFFAAAR